MNATQTTNCRMRPHHPDNAIDILLVEDNPGDVRLTREAFKESRGTNSLNVVEDGAEALAFLNHQGKYNNAPTPDLILLDLNLPKKDGREVLEEIKNDKALRRIPVVVLTTSSAAEDVFNMYQRHANCYIKKPIDFEDFVNVITAIDNFWLTMVKLPSK